MQGAGSNPTELSRRQRHYAFAAMLAVCASLAIVADGCSIRRQFSKVTPVTMRSEAAGASLQIDPTMSVLIRRDEQTMVVYLTDLSPMALAGPLDRLTGSVVRIDRFFAPRAGRTPLEATASNAAVRWVVFAAGAMGVYQGGGMLELDQSILTGQKIRAILRGATLRLGGATDDFVDKLGATTASGVFVVADDAVTARRLAALVEAALARSAPIEETTEPARKPANAR